MSDDTTTPTVIDPRRREARPERIDIGDDVLVRDDVHARELHQTTRATARADKKGAPFVKIGSTKYRPRKRFNAWLTSQIQTLGVKPKPRRASR